MGSLSPSDSLLPSIMVESDRHQLVQNQALYLNRVYEKLLIGLRKIGFFCFEELCKSVFQ
jgi:hypothetical protein